MSRTSSSGASDGYGQFCDDDSNATSSNSIKKSVERKVPSGIKSESSNSLTNSRVRKSRGRGQPIQPNGTENSGVSKVATEKSSSLSIPSSGSSHSLISNGTSNLSCTANYSGLTKVHINPNESHDFIQKVNDMKNEKGNFEVLENYYRTYQDKKGDKVFQMPNYEQLPILKKKTDIIDNLRRENCVVLTGETGSGKTTQVPQYILDDYVSRGQDCNIWVTQPRRIAALSVAERVSSYRAKSTGLASWGQIGKIVGYQIGLEKKVSRDTRITYMTPAIVSNKMRSDPALKEVTVLIIDEVHERDLETEMLLLLVKNLLNSESTIKVLLMSATINATDYRDYLVSGNCQPKLVMSEGKNFGVKEKYIEDVSREICPDYPLTNVEFANFQIQEPVISTAVQKAVTLIINNLTAIEEKMSKQESATIVQGAVLVFLPGLTDILDMERYINVNVKEPHIILKVHSCLNPKTPEFRSRLMKPNKYGKRKIILSTNICESSLTVPDVVHVLDLCLTKQSEKDEETNLTQLKMSWASQSHCNQRMGRAGRTRDGYCWRLVPKEFFRLLKEHCPPEIERVPLEPCVLLGKGIFPSLTPMQFLEKACTVPSQKDVTQAVLGLKELQALTMKCAKSKNTSIKANDMDDGDLTPLGTLMNLLPLDLPLCRMIYFGNAMGLIMEAIIIAVGINTQNFWEYAKEERIREGGDTLADEFFNSYHSKLYWARGSESDHIAVFNAFRAWYSKMGKAGSGCLEDLKKVRSSGLKMFRSPQYEYTESNKEYKWCTQFGLNRKGLTLKLLSFRC